MRLWMLSVVVLGLVGLAYQGDGAVGAQGGTYLFPSGNGDVNRDQKIDISDPVFLLQYLYLGGPEPEMLQCEPFAIFHNGDVNGSGTIDVSDPIYLLYHLFLGGSPPKEGCPPEP